MNVLVKSLDEAFQELVKASKSKKGGMFGYSTPIPHALFGNVRNPERPNRIPKKKGEGSRAKGRVKRHTRTTKTGKVVIVQEHDSGKDVAKKLGFNPKTESWGRSRDDHSDHHAKWSKSGGHAGAKKVSAVIKRAKELGFEHKSVEYPGSPDGSVVGTRNEYHHPSGWVLRGGSSYGSTARDNHHHLHLEHPGKKSAKMDKALVESLDEAYVELVKARTRGAKDKRPRKKRGLKGLKVKPIVKSGSSKDHATAIINELIRSKSLGKQYQQSHIKQVQNDLKNFKLKGDAPANIGTIAEMTAGENLGGRPGEGLTDEHFYEGGSGVQEELNAWRRVARKAAELCGAMNLPVTNANVLLMMHHKKAHELY